MSGSSVTTGPKADTTDDSGNHAANAQALESSEALRVIVAPSIDGPADALLPPTDGPRYHLNVIAAHWARIRRTLLARDYVSGEELAVALIAHRHEPVEALVLPYLCSFLMGKVRKPRAKRPRSSR
jgi:hypothetical protein